MRIAPTRAVVLAVLAACAVIGCGIEQLTQGGSSSAATAAPTDGGADAADSSLTGAGCGIEGTSGTELCRATSQCPTVVVDSQAFPHCGFRIRGGTSELVCGCGEAMICSMGAFTTCAQASKLLASQSEGSVCAQISEDRCTQAVPTSTGGSNSKPTCDRTCLVECGSGAGCASICGC